MITPSYNYAQYIESAVASVGFQDVDAEVKHYVWDGSSNDGSPELLQSLSARFDRLQVVSEKDAGQSDALNKAFALGSGDWVLWLNADEFLLPDALARLLAAARARPGTALVTGDCVFVSGTGSVQRLRPGHRSSVRALKQYGCYVNSCATLVRRQVMGSRPWDVRLRRYMDWDLWLRLQKGGTEIRYTPVVAAGFRVHPHQVTAAPESAAEVEGALVREKYAINSPSAYSLLEGRVQHAVAKMPFGFVRQRAMARLRGTDIDDWWKHAGRRRAASAVARV